MSTTLQEGKKKRKEEKGKADEENDADRAEWKRRFPSKECETSMRFI